MVRNAPKKETYRDHQTIERPYMRTHDIADTRVVGGYDEVGVSIVLPEAITADDWAYLKDALTYFDDSDLMVRPDREIDGREYEIGSDMRTITFEYRTDEPHNSRK